jgi:hypothetical protein
VAPAASASAEVPAGKQFFAHGLLDPANAERSFTFCLAVIRMTARMKTVLAIKVAIAKICESVATSKYVPIP